MENASKALVIAGAILVSILLISIGVLIINSTNKMTDQVGSSSDTMAIQSFNAQFTAYEGTENTAAQIKELRSKVNASNAANNVTTEGQPKYIKFELSSEITSMTALLNTSRYTVNLNYASTGYIDKVTVSTTVIPGPIMIK